MNKKSQARRGAMHVNPWSVNTANSVKVGCIMALTCRNAGMSIP